MALILVHFHTIFRSDTNFDEIQDPFASKQQIQKSPESSPKNASRKSRFVKVPSFWGKHNSLQDIFFFYLILNFDHRDIVCLCVHQVVIHLNLQGSVHLRVKYM